MSRVVELGPQNSHTSIHISIFFFWRPLFTITPKREPFSELTFLHLAFGCEKVGLEFNWRKQILMLEGNIPSMRVRVKIASFGYDSLMMYMLLLISDIRHGVHDVITRGWINRGTIYLSSFVLIYMFNC